MTDYMRIHTRMGIKTLPIEPMGITWPPPKVIQVAGPNFRIMDGRPDDRWPKGDEIDELMVRVSMSQISDERIKLIPNLARGAEYVYIREVDPKAVPQVVFLAIPLEVRLWVWK